MAPTATGVSSTTRSSPWPDPRPDSWSTAADPAVDDLGTAAQEAIRLGATEELRQAGPERARVLRDPAGHPFCLRA
jgi:hypothetical protein